jgi:fructokinase
MSQRILAVGEVLWDLLPAGKQLGGAPANFAYHARSLGADARLVSRVGADPLGREVHEWLRLLDLPTETLQVDADAETGTVDIWLGADGQPHYTIRSDVAWDRIEADPPALELAARADAVCFGSLAQRAETSRGAIRSIVEAAPEGALCVFDVNLRPPFVDREVIAGSLELANVLKLNDHELPELAAMFGLGSGPREAIEGLAHRFELSLVALTRGAAGSLLWADGVWSDHPGCPAEVVDTVGAGDAFTAALAVGLLAGAPLGAINRRANEIAAFVCSCAGATPPLPEALKREGKGGTP